VNFLQAVFTVHWKQSRMEDARSEPVDSCSEELLNPIALNPNLSLKFIPLTLLQGAVRMRWKEEQTSCFLKASIFFSYLPNFLPLKKKI
jgi:hypothetical protein